MTFRNIFSIVIPLAFLLMAGCAGFMLWVSMEYVEMTAQIATEHRPTYSPSAEDFVFSHSAGEQRLQALGLKDAAAEVPAIRVALAYATTENFTGTVQYPDVRRAYLRPEAIAKLQRAAELLQTFDSTLHLVVLDAARPQAVQKRLWEYAVAGGMGKYVASPWMGSVHNYGCAVDVTLAGPDSLLDMGTAYDHFGPEAEPRFHQRLLQDGTLSQTQVDNRLLLRRIMREAGFQAIDSEWWHFNALSKNYVRFYFEMIP